MKKFFSLLLIISFCFVGNIYGSSSSEGSSVVPAAAFKSDVSSCSWNIDATRLINKALTRLVCTVKGNASTMIVKSKSKNSGILINKDNAKLTPLTYTHSGAVLYTPANSGEMNLANFSSVATFSRSSAAATVGTITVGTADNATLTPSGTFGVSLKMNHDYGDLIEVFEGSYTDTITISIHDGTN